VATGWRGRALSVRGGRRCIPQTSIRGAPCRNLAHPWAKPNRVSAGRGRLLPGKQRYANLDAAVPMWLTRPEVCGKFLWLGSQKLYIRGVTDGTFRPDADGHEYPSRGIVDCDFAKMAVNGVNAVRTYTAPPVWLLLSFVLLLRMRFPPPRFVGSVASPSSVSCNKYTER
jgi:hypothetical protein